ncbi:MAG: sensory box histidine kinase [Betaproteobacteria bacterium]|nr:sensory box histidine kinase [Betaproteobacteria bacterium]
MPTHSSNDLFVRRRARLVAYALALAMLLGVAGVFTLSSWNRAVERHERGLETRVVMGSHAVNAYLMSIELSLADLGDRLKGAPAAAAGPLLKAYKQRHPEFEVMAVIGLDGEIVATTWGTVANANELPFFAEARERLLKGERMNVSRPFLGRTVPRWLIQLRYGVRDPSGRLLFTVGGGVPVERAQAFWKDVPLPPGADMGLLREDLYAVARYPVPQSIGERVYTEPQPGLLSDYLREHHFPAAGVVRGFSAALESDATVAFQHLQDYPIYFVSVNPRGILLKEWWESAWPTYALLLLLFAGGMGIVGWIGRRQMAMQREREARVAELEDLTARLENTNAELEAYMYSVSHDLRAPIRAIDGYSAILQEELTPAAGAEAGRLLGRIRASTGRMNDLLNDLLDLSRYSTQELHRENIDMRQEVEAVIAELGAQSGANPGANPAAARFEIGALPDCRGDRILLRQVWGNLLANALKYSAGAANPLICVGFAGDHYFVTDNGAGFDMAYADKLFRLFSRLHTESEYAGTGVGLAIVKRIVERHGGKIHATGTPGAGARFWFSIPA